MVFEKIREIICDLLELEPEDVTMDSVLRDDLGADSLDLADMVATLEEEFDLSVADEDIEHILTVADIVKYVEEH
ncbi:MAG: acyl carrier protein [Clostridiales bacterium]|nr:acyl carrier protein [Clostridiales bacterium]